MPTLLRALPNIPTLKQRARALAMLDAILCPDWQYRKFLFDPAWGNEEQMAKQDDGSGNDCFVVFAAAGCFIRGFDHESEMTPWAHDPPRVWPGVLSDVPKAFAPMVSEPAFSSATSTTFCLWRGTSDDRWHCGNVAYPDGNERADGSADLLGPYIEAEPWYLNFAKEYFEVQIPAAPVHAIFAGKPLTREIVHSL